METLCGFQVLTIVFISICRPQKVHLLDTQYRMDPGLLEFANTVFYDKRVKSDSSVWNREPLVQNPFKLISTSEDGAGTEDRKGFSWFNDYEASVVKYVLQHDEDILCILGTLEEEARIIVITPYTAQVEKLRKVLKPVMCLRGFDISTVDSFQGQEADIVVVSTVRTDSVGFVDNANRLCVALTRAKRVLRVVGDANFFASIASEGSVLRRLADFALKRGLVDRADVGGAAWRRPQWPKVTSWRPTMTARFHDCLKNLTRGERNVAFNVLLALSIPQVNLLRRKPDGERARWQLSSLQKGGDVHITWLAREFIDDGDGGAGQQYVGIIEAHYAGNRDECLTFTQRHHLLPHYARGVTEDLTGIKVPPPDTEPTELQFTDADLRRWQVTNEVQAAVIDELVSVLPEGLFCLDKQQERILYCKPPLLLESRSGTGKTNVLFQHAVCYARELVAADTAPRSIKAICFVTVSKKLQKELKERYEEVKKMVQQIVLPPIQFFSFVDFLQKLIEYKKILYMDVSKACRYLQYIFARKSHQRLEIEAS
jgi:hypothetical protein